MIGQSGTTIAAESTVATVSPPHPPGSLGELLRRARERRGLTLDTLAKETKIPRRHLEALEHDDLAAAPGRFYQRAEIRAYARAVGLDQDRALTRLEAALKADDPTQTAPEVPRSQWATNARAYVSVVVGIAVVTAAWYGPAFFTLTPAPGGGAETSQRQAPELVAPVAAPAQPLAPLEPRAVSATPADPVVASDGQVTPSVAHAAAVTELVVTTQPAGARVTVNGIGWGISPVTIPHVTPGDKRIRVSKDGYHTVERVLRVSEGRSHTLDISLNSAP
jgi:cytoskeletal protein RodZ